MALHLPVPRERQGDPAYIPMRETLDENFYFIDSREFVCRKERRVVAGCSAWTEKGSRRRAGKKSGWRPQSKVVLGA